MGRGGDDKRRCGKDGEKSGTGEVELEEEGRREVELEGREEVRKRIKKV